MYFNQHKSTVTTSKPANSENILDSMTIEEKVGQLLMPDIRTWEGEDVTSINDDIKSLINEYHLGGIILFKENFVNRSQATTLIQQLKDSSTSEIPMMISVDQEGGIVTRLPFFPKMPGNMALGATTNPDLSHDVGLAIGSELRRLGIHVNFGPVVDVNNNPNNPVIGVRAFGDNVELVQKMSTAYMHGLNEAGVIAVSKHFPGHGDVDLDSHYVLPSSNKTLEQLRSLELPPFQTLIDEKVQGIMTAHITFKEISAQTVKSQKDGLPIHLPATLSPEIINGLLREEMGYKGVVFSDAMDMKAISNHFGAKEAAVMAVEAGVDVVLMPDNVQHAYEGILEAVESGRLSEARINESVNRILKLKSSKFFKEEATFKKLTIQQATKVEDTVAGASITLVKNDGTLPFVKDSNEKIALVAENKDRLKALENAIKVYNWKVTPILISKGKNQTGRLTEEQASRLKESDKVVIATYSATMDDRSSESWQMKTVQQILGFNIPSVVISTRNPYDLSSLTGVNAYISQYDDGSASFNSTAEVIYGVREAKGKLPVEIE